MDGGGRECKLEHPWQLQGGIGPPRHDILLSPAHRAKVSHDDSVGSVNSISVQASGYSVSAHTITLAAASRDQHLGEQHDWR